MKLVSHIDQKNCHCNICLWNILIFVLYIRIWHGDLNLRYQSIKGNHGGEVNVCQEFQLALAGAPDSSYKSSKKKHTPLLGTLISALIYCFTVFLPCPENAPPREGLTLAPPRPVNFDPCPAPKKISPAPPRPEAKICCPVHPWCGAFYKNFCSFT